MAADRSWQLQVSIGQTLTANGCLFINELSCFGKRLSSSRATGPQLLNVKEKRATVPTLAKPGYTPTSSALGDTATNVTKPAPASTVFRRKPTDFPRLLRTAWHYPIDSRAVPMSGLGGSSFTDAHTS